MEKTITIKIDPLGRATVDGQNFEGMECDAAMAPIERALAGDGGGSSRDDKPEYYAPSGGQTAKATQGW